jgi:uncharacterized coiled-coil DUF342 family protein
MSLDKLKADDKSDQMAQEVEHLRKALREAHEKIKSLTEEVALVKLRLSEASNVYRTNSGEAEV